MSLLRIAMAMLPVMMLVACSGPSNEAAGSEASSTATPTQSTATATEIASPTATVPPATATITATPTATPSAIPVSPTATSTPSATPKPTNTSTATSTATATTRPATASPTPTVEQETPTPAPTATTPTASEELASDIDALLDGRQGLYEVVVIDPDGKTLYDRDSGIQLQSASLYKLLIMVETYRQLDEGIVALDDPVTLYPGFFHEAGFDDPFGSADIGSTVTVEDLIYPMIAFSSNVAAFALLNLVGNTNINQTVADLGMTASEIRWMPALEGSVPDVDPSLGLASYASIFLQTPSSPPTADDAFNVTDAADTALLFRLLIEGKVVSTEASQAMLDLLSAQVVNDRLPALLPADVVVAHKTGNIDNVVHDAGVIYAPGGPIVTVVLTQDALEWEAVEFMNELALLVYDFSAR